MAEGFDISQLGENITILKQKGEAPSAAREGIELDLSYLFEAPGDPNPIFRADFEDIASTLIEYNRKLLKGEGDILDKGIPMTGWLTTPEKIQPGYLNAIRAAADELASGIDAFVSLGIGGSYLGIEATWKALTHTHWNQLSRRERGGRPEVYFLGNNMDPDYHRDTLDMLKGKRVGVNVISKSGTTTETAIAFRIIRDLMEASFGETSRELIIATTDAAKGALRKLASEKGYKSFIVPDDVGGRYSVITEVGLFGLAVLGIDIDEFTAGFRDMKRLTDTDCFWENPALLHAAARHLAYSKGKKIEVVASNSAALYQVCRWMEQLFPESEGHGGKGMWVSPSLYSEKLHANGQMVQEGERNLIETFIYLKNHDNTMTIPFDEDDYDGLNYLPEAGKTMNDINRLAVEGPAYAHYHGGVPNMTITVPARTPYHIGSLYMMLERSAALSGCLLGHNPFIQPGVEAYKRAIFALAGKPGFEEEGERIIATIKSSK